MRRKRRWVNTPTQSPEAIALQTAQFVAYEKAVKEKQAAQALAQAQYNPNCEYGEVRQVPIGEGEKLAVWVHRLNPEDLVKQAQAPKRGPNADEGQRMIDRLTKGSNEYSGDFYGDVQNFGQIEGLLKGWSDGAARARKLMDELGCELPMAESTRRRRVVGQDGTDVIVEAWIDKDIDRLFESRKRFTTMGHRIIQIGMSWGGNANRGMAEMFWGGAAALVLTEMLESAGYGVEVHAYDYTIPSGHAVEGKQAMLLDMLVKPSDQTISPDTFAALLAHPAVYRGLGMPISGHCPINLGFGMGRNQNIDNVAASLADAGVIQPIELLLPSIYNKQTALETVRRSLMDMGAIPK